MKGYGSTGGQSVDIHDRQKLAGLTVHLTRSTDVTVAVPGNVFRNFTDNQVPPVPVA